MLKPLGLIFHFNVFVPEMEQSLSAVDKQSEHDSDKYPERSQSPTREQGPSPQTMGGVSWGWEENRNEEGAGD